MKFIRYPALLCAALCFAGMSKAQTPTAGELRKYCLSTQKGKTQQTTGDIFNTGVCMGYARGFMDSIDGRTIYIEQKKTTYLLSVNKDAKEGGAIVAFLKFMDEHTDMFDGPALAAYIPAMVAAKIVTYTPIEQTNGK